LSAGVFAVENKKPIQNRRADTRRSPGFRVDRYWLITWTTYGTWLPGDERGFVSGTKDGLGNCRIHNQPGSEYDQGRRGMALYAQRTQVSSAIRLTPKQAAAVLEQIRATAAVRKWRICAVAVMSSHVHVVVGVPGDPEPDTILRDLKSFASRALNRLGGDRHRWWTQSGSTRKLPDEAAVLAAVRYVRDQEYPLAIECAGQSK
jgi:REP element-mobilizing transposase RayT